MPHITALPFVQAQENGQPASLWSVAPSGVWAADNDVGGAHADALLIHIATTGQPFLLGHVMKAIAEAGAWTGIECGFCHRIAARAAA